MLDFSAMKRISMFTFAVLIGFRSSMMSFRPANKAPKDDIKDAGTE